MEQLTKTEKVQWRNFIGTAAGQKGMMWLRESIPAIGGDNPHQTVFQAGYNQGYIKCLDKITETIIVREPESEDLENA